MEYPDLFLRIQHLRKNKQSGIVVVKIPKTTKRFDTKKFWKTTDIVIFLEPHDNLLCLVHGKFSLVARESQEAKDILHKIEVEENPLDMLDRSFGGSDYNWLISAPYKMDDKEFALKVAEKYKESLQ